MKQRSSRDKKEGTVLRIKGKRKSWSVRAKAGVPGKVRKGRYDRKKGKGAVKK